MKLSKKLEELNSYPFHMPGHKRNTQYNITASDIDITEIDGFDNLHSPSDVLADMQYSLSDIYGYSKSIISVNGSTCCILSAISAVCTRGQDIIIARNCHKSVYNACLINNLKIHYIEPEFNSEFGMYIGVTQEAVNDAVNAFPNSCAVVLTSPTYEGFISNIICDIPLIIDAAHGAHFGMNDCFPDKQKGDIIIHSLHKTLPSLTQSAVIHIDNLHFYDKVKMFMDIYETSSPSYVIMSSIDKCIDFLKNSKTNFEIFAKRLNDFYSELNELENIVRLKNDDPSRIVLMSKSVSGTDFCSMLRKYGIEPEGATANYVILISTVCDTDEGFRLLLNALRKINTVSGKFVPRIHKCQIPESAENKGLASGVITPLMKCEGKVCAEFIYAYPPGVPIIAPNEIITNDIIESLNDMIRLGVNVISDNNLLPDKVLTY